jgi:hypothetical protein
MGKFKLFHLAVPDMGATASIGHARPKRKGVLRLHLSVAAAVLALVGMADRPANARGMAVDDWYPSPASSCALTGPCSPSNLGGVYDDANNQFLNVYTGPGTFNAGVFSDVYIYNDGVISIGGPLPSTASFSGGLASLGKNYIAVGFNDYSGLGGTGVGAEVTAPLVPVLDPSGEFIYYTYNNPYDLRIYWFFNAPLGAGPPGVTPATSPENAIFGVELFYAGNGVMQVSLAYGASVNDGTWYLPSVPYCDLVCEAGGDNVAGNYLPVGTLIGSSYATFPPVTISGDCTANPNSCTDFSGAGLTTFDIPTAVPEPDTWIMVICGLGVIGTALRIRRRQIGRTEGAVVV